MNGKPLIALVTALLVAGSCGTSRASIEVGFSKLSQNATEDLSGQLKLWIYGSGEANPYHINNSAISVGATQALFVFQNDVGIASDVTEIYMDDGSILGIATVFNTNDADSAAGLQGSDSILLAGLTTFHQGNPLHPPVLSDGNLLDPDFEVTAAFSVDSDTPGSPPNDGLNAATERVAILYDLQTYDGLNGLEAVDQALADEALRIGFHVRSIGVSGQSSAYINTSGGGGGISQIVPEPGSMAVWTLLCLVGGIAAVRRRCR